MAVERSILDRIERMRNRFNCVFNVKLDGEDETIPVIIRSFQVREPGGASDILHQLARIASYTRWCELHEFV